MPSKKAISYIRIHYAENISLEEIADRLDITPEYLSTLFNREVGMNFTVFLRDFRISHARRLLKGTDKRSVEIARKWAIRIPNILTGHLRRKWEFPHGSSGRCRRRLPLCAETMRSCRLKERIKHMKQNQLYGRTIWIFLVAAVWILTACGKTHRRKQRSTKRTACGMVLL